MIYYIIMGLIGLLAIGIIIGIIVSIAYTIFKFLTKRR